MIPLSKISRGTLIPLFTTFILFLSVSTGVVLVQRQQELRTKAASAILFNGDFETGNISGWKCSGNCPTVVTSPTRAGKYSLMSILDAKTSKVNYRTELRLQAVNDFPFGKEYWLGVSTYLPSGWSDNYISSYDQGMLWQFHDRGFNDPSWRSGLPLVLNHYEGKFIIQRRGHPSSKTFWEAPYEKGKWTDWVINVKWSKGSDGFINIWKDGEQLVSEKGANYYSEHTDPPYFKMGLYQWGWDEGKPLGTTQRTIYHDEVRIAQGSNGYNLVIPSGSPSLSSTPPPTTTLTPTPTSIPFPGCRISTSFWQNFPLSSQTGIFSVEYDVISIDQNPDAIVALSTNPGSVFDDYAALVRFNNGILDVRNGSSYSFDKQVPYIPGTSYHFKQEVNVPARTYSVWVTPEGGSTQKLATDYALRSSQSTISSINNWGIWSGTGSSQVCNFTLTSTSTTGSTPTPIKILTSLPGDINSDMIINVLDFQILSNNFGTSDTDSDLNSDGIVNILDFQILSNNFGKTSG